MDNKLLADLLFPDIKTTPDDMEKRFPPRNLPEGAAVTRFAPSPTGFVHFGGMFPTRVSERIAHQSNGIFFLRIEDTDSKREVQGAEKNLIITLENYGIIFDEGATADGGDKGAYGPYRQSQRSEIYQTYGRELVIQGKAYPCFCTSQELDAIRIEQEENKYDPGYYGRWAIWREADLDSIKKKLNEQVPFVLRLRSEGNISNKIKFNDLVKGEIEITENDKDHVLLKSDRIPTYHFAHAVDDHLMRTTHVVRGEEWLPSLPFHIQLFSALNFKLPKYLHISQLMKLEGNSKKKLSKRDQGVDMRWYDECGYPSVCLTEYVMTLLNSNFEEWRASNPDKPFIEFKFSIKKMSPSGCLLDSDKLNDVCKNTLARLTSDEIYKGVTAWAEQYDFDLADKLKNDADYAKRIFSIGRGGTKPRKDLATWADVKPYISLFYDDYFKTEADYPTQFDRADIKETLRLFAETYDETDDSDIWFAKIKLIAEKIGYAPETKLYKKNPSEYKGHVGDISMFIRIAVTGKINSPDLYDVLHILGRQRTIDRIIKQLV